MTSFIPFLRCRSFFSDDFFHESRRIFHGGSEHFGHDYGEPQNTHEHSPVYATQAEAMEKKALNQQLQDRQMYLKVDFETVSESSIKLYNSEVAMLRDEVSNLNLKNKNLRQQLSKAQKENPQAFKTAELRSAIKFQCGNGTDNKVLAVGVHSSNPEKVLQNVACNTILWDMAKYNIECFIDGKEIGIDDLKNLSIDQLSKIEVEDNTLGDVAESVAGDCQFALDNVCIIAKAMRDPATAQYVRREIKPTDDSVAKKIAMRGIQEGSHPPVSTGAQAGHYKKTHPKNTVSQGAVPPSVEGGQVEAVVEYLFQNPVLLAQIRKAYKEGNIDPHNRYHSVYTATTPDEKFWLYPELHIHDDASILSPGSQKKRPPHPSAQNPPVSPSSAYAGNKKPNPALPQNQKPSHPPAQNSGSLTPHPSSAPATSLNTQKPNLSEYDGKATSPKKEEPANKSQESKQEKKSTTEQNTQKAESKEAKEFLADPIRALEGIEDFRNTKEVDEELIIPLFSVILQHKSLEEIQDAIDSKKDDMIKIERTENALSAEFENGESIRFQNNPGKIEWKTTWAEAKADLGSEFFKREDEDFLIEQFQKSTLAWGKDTKPKGIRVLQNGEHEGARIVEYKNYALVIYQNDGGMVKGEVVAKEDIPEGKKEESKKDSEESKELTKEQKTEQTKKFQKLLRAWGYTKKIDGDIHISEDKKSQSENAIKKAIDFAKEKMTEEEGMKDLSLKDFQDQEEKDFATKEGLSLLEKITDFKNNYEAQRLLKKNGYYDDDLDGKIRLKEGGKGKTIQGLEACIKEKNPKLTIDDFLNEDNDAFTAEGVQKLKELLGETSDDEEEDKDKDDGESDQDKGEKKNEEEGDKETQSEDQSSFMQILNTHFSEAESRTPRGCLNEAMVYMGEHQEYFVELDDSDKILDTSFDWGADGKNKWKKRDELFFNGSSDAKELTPDGMEIIKAIDHHKTIFDLQTKLQKMGYYQEEADGKFGDTSSNALKNALHDRFEDDDTEVRYYVNLRRNQDRENNLTLKTTPEYKEEIIDKYITGVKESLFDSEGKASVMRMEKITNALKQKEVREGYVIGEKIVKNTPRSLVRELDKLGSGVASLSFVEKSEDTYGQIESFSTTDVPLNTVKDFLWSAHEKGYIQKGSSLEKFVAQWKDEDLNIKDSAYFSYDEASSVGPLGVISQSKTISTDFQKLLKHIGSFYGGSLDSGIPLDKFSSDTNLLFVDENILKKISEIQVDGKNVSDNLAGYLYKNGEVVKKSASAS